MAEQENRFDQNLKRFLADYFYRRGIPYKYEKPLYLETFWYGLSGFSRSFPKDQEGNILTEHDGRMDDPVYAERSQIQA